jgi:hypothetical protein
VIWQPGPTETDSLTPVARQSQHLLGRLEARSGRIACGRSALAVRADRMPHERNDVRLAIAGESWPGTFRVVSYFRRETWDGLSEIARSESDQVARKMLLNHAGSTTQWFIAALAPDSNDVRLILGMRH